MLLSYALMACGSDEGGDDTSVPSSGETPFGFNTDSEVPSDILSQIDNANPLKTVGISDAVGLIITDDSGEATKLSAKARALVSEKTSRNFEGSFSNNTLYKVLADGTITEVPLYDSSGNNIRGSLTPIKMAEMGNGWTLLTFETTFKYVTHYTYQDLEGDVYDVNQTRRNLAYLVHNQTGTTYEAEWALAELDSRDIIIYDFGDDNIYDLGVYNTHTGILKPSNEYITNYTTTLAIFHKYDRFPAATFDEQGRMYVAGIVLDPIDPENPRTRPYYKPRILRIDTNNVGADTLTAEVIQTTDLDVEINPKSITVSADGLLLYYTARAEDFSTIYRLVNLRDNASYAVQSIENGGPAIRGKDGALYTITHDKTDEFEYISSIDVDVISRYSLIDGENKPIAEQTALVNEGQAVDVNEYPYVSHSATLAEWNELKSLVSNIPTFSDWSEYYAWKDASGFSALYDKVSEQPYLRRTPTSSQDRHVVSGNVVLVNRNDWSHIPEYHMILDLPNGIIKDYKDKDLGFDNYNALAYNDESLFFFGKDADTTLDRIVRWTPGLDVETVKVDIDTDTFDVTRFKVLSQDSVLFEADILNPFPFGNIELTAGAKVLAEADFEGNVNIIDTIEASEAAVLVMERIGQGDLLVADGDPNDWPIDYRSLTDATEDSTNTTAGDLTYLSSFEDDDYLWLLLKGHSDFADTRTLITLDDTTQINIESTEATLLDSSGDETVSQSLASFAGIHAKAGDIIELRLPKSVVPASLDLSVKTEIDGTFGEISYVSELIDEEAKTISLTINLDSPLGPVEGEVSFLTDYAVTISDYDWDNSMAASHDDLYTLNLIDNTTGSEVVTTLSDAGGSYSVTDNAITIILPFTAVGIIIPELPTSLSAEIESSSEVIALPVDSMN